tara:strand:+ start:3931 stop:4137 length:207 start_codon:yes stop_codon:yes gene_type:complete
MKNLIESLQIIVDLSHKAQMSGTDRLGLELALINIELVAQTGIDKEREKLAAIVNFPSGIGDRPSDTE